MKGVAPMQADLKNFMNIYRARLTTLSIITDSTPNKKTPLSFETLGLLPNLTSLTLVGICATSITLTEAHAPKLRQLVLDRVSFSDEGDSGLRLELSELRELRILNVRVEGPSGLGMSLCCCPRLEKLLIRKLRAVDGDMFIILPSAESVELENFEGTYNLEILSAPKLRWFSVVEMRSLRNLRLWDLPWTVCVGDVIRLGVLIGEAGEKVWTEVQNWVKDWDGGRLTGRDAFMMDWIAEREIPKFNVMDFQVMNCIDDASRMMFESRLREAKNEIWTRFLRDLGIRPIVNGLASLPGCKVHCCGLDLTQESLQHLDANKRIFSVSSCDGEMFANEEKVAGMGQKDK